MPPAATKKYKRKDRSCLICLTWILILSWIAFIVFFWRSGLLHSSQNPTLLFVEKMLNTTESSVKSRLRNVHLTVPIAHLPEKGFDFSFHGSDGSEGAFNLPGIVEKRKTETLHIIFSTDCNAYQDWQTLLIFHSAMVVGQEGVLTRIASGCDENKARQLTELYKKLFPMYRVHFTPDFKRDEKTQRSYDFYNKPRGLQHWLEKADPPISDDSIIALVDPDMIFVRPLILEIKNNSNLIVPKKVRKTLQDRVALGYPVAQQYGLGAPWTNDNHKKFNRGKICGEGSPCLLPTQQYGELHYAVGAPYVVHKLDMQRIAESWVRLVPRVYEGYPYLLAEMYAYSMAAAHEKLPHLQVLNHMVSNVGDYGEGWPWVDALSDVCEPPDANGRFFSGKPMVTFVHFCQNYRAGNIGFGKRAVPHDIFSCASPMLVEPPRDLDKADFRIHKNKVEKLTSAKAKQNAFAICVIHRAINAALTYYKSRMCDPSQETVNYNKSMIILKNG